MLHIQSLQSLEKESQVALQEDAKEQDEIVKRGEAIKLKLEGALGDASEVTVEVW